MPETEHDKAIQKAADWLRLAERGCVLTGGGRF